MDTAPSSGPKAQRAKRNLPFERVVFVLQGGGALGAYQAGVYEALAEANIEPDWICGISIGAINTALIVGNPPEKRVERLREFWTTVTEPPVKLPGVPWFAELPWGGGQDIRKWTIHMSTTATMLYGAPGFFVPRNSPPLTTMAQKPDEVSLYDTSPLKATLEKLVDFDLINKVPIQLSVGATSAKTGVMVYFENTRHKIRAAHIIASGALPPGFPPIEIDGEYYWDGGVVSNTALQHVADRRPLYTSLVFRVDLWDPVGDMPLDITAANLRTVEIHGASHLNISLDQFKRLQRMRRTLGLLLDTAPEAVRNRPEVRELAEEAHLPLASIVRLKYRAKNYEGSSKIFDFSRQTMEERWKAGYDDMRAALNEPLVLELPDVSEGVRVFDVHLGWIK
jgi:NTE family protein